MKSMKILFLAANPSNTARLSLDEEVREITMKVRLSRYAKHVTLHTRWAVRPDDLLDALNDVSPHVVHFSGHGSGSSGLLLQDKAGKPAIVSSSALSKLFKTLKDEINLVVLNACFSEHQAQAIVDTIGCVVGMNHSINDKAAIRFSSSFYRAIGFGRSIQDAFDQGVTSIALEALEDEEIPKLLCRENTDPARLFLCGHTNTPTPKSVSQYKNRRNLERLLINSERKITQISKLDRQAGNLFLKNEIPKIIDSVGHTVEFAIVMADIDELTIINKQYGEAVGNRVLLVVEEILRGKENEETSSRCGDDTFYIFLPGLNSDETFMVAKEVCSEVESYPWSCIAKGLHVTCSLGVAQLSKDEPIKDWLVRAACGMISAKEHGKNRVEFGPDFLSVKQSRDLDDYYS